MNELGLEEKGVSDMEQGTDSDSRTAHRRQPRRCSTEIDSRAQMKPSDDGYEVTRKGVQAFIAELLAPQNDGRAGRQGHRRRA